MVYLVNTEGILREYWNTEGILIDYLGNTESIFTV